MSPKVVESQTSSDGAQSESIVQRDRLPQMKATSWLGTTLILVAIGLGSLFLGGICWFGSTASALAFLRGDGLIPDVYTKTFGTVDKDERPSIEFLLNNYTRRPIKVLGANFSCTCLATSDLPVVVPPKGSTTLRVSVRAKRGPGRYSEWLRLVTDPSETHTVLRVQGVFR